MFFILKTEIYKNRFYNVQLAVRPRKPFSFGSTTLWQCVRAWEISLYKRLCRLSANDKLTVKLYSIQTSVSFSTLLTCHPLEEKFLGSTQSRSECEMFLWLWYFSFSLPLGVNRPSVKGPFTPSEAKKIKVQEIKEKIRFRFSRVWIALNARVWWGAVAGQGRLACC